MNEQRRLVPLFAHGLLAIASFAIVTSAIRSAMPWPDDYGMRAKLEAFEATKDEYDAVFLGSSDVFRSFDPSVIDEIISQNRSEFRSFNLGIPATGSFEQDLVLRWVLSRKPAKLRWLVVEAPSWGIRIDDTRETERDVHWHSPGQTWGALNSIWLKDQDVRAKLRGSRHHLSLAALRVANYARGLSLWSALSVGESGELRAQREAFESTRGYQALETLADEGSKNRRLRFRQNLDDYRNKRDRLRSREQMPSTHQYNRSALSRLEALARDHELELVWVIPPGLQRRNLLVQLHQEGHFKGLINYRQPDVYPELYQLDSRYDGGHLSRRGARIFSEIHARDLLRRIRVEESGR